MLRVDSLKLDPRYDDNDLKAAILKRLKIGDGSLLSYRIIRKSIDARDKTAVCYVLSVTVSVKNESSILHKRIKNVSAYSPVTYTDPKPAGNDIIKSFKQPVIVGFGPAGMTCAYMLAKAGMKPIVLERGLDVDSRTKMVKAFWEGGQLDINTNVQFGEGGAGTFSDGKLSTMIHDRVGRIGEFFRILVENGADESILYNAKPHVGTDRLSIIVKNIRKKIISLGGEVRFGSTLRDIITDEDHRIKEAVVECGGRTYTIPTGVLVLSIGHSARDTFEMLKEKGLRLEPKPFAVGVRVQHSQEMISISQYGKDFYKKLPPADYKLTYNSERLKRSVYSFCMCPGGYVVNSSSEEGRLVINGMSYSDRGERTANSAIVVNVDRRDLDDDSWNAGIRFQQRLEELAFKECSGKIPVQTYADFSRKGAFAGSGLHVNGPEFNEGRHNLPNTKGFWDYGDIHHILPGQLCEAISEAFPDFGSRIDGFDLPDTLLMGVESRTSSPVRIVRNDDLYAEGFEGIYPCGEGAGYAGGITSAAVDGIRVYEKIFEKHLSGVSIY